MLHSVTCYHNNAFSIANCTDSSGSDYYCNHNSVYNYTVVSVVCFIVLSKKKTAGEFIIIIKSPTTPSMMIFFYYTSSIPTTGCAASQW